MMAIQSTCTVNRQHNKTTNCQMKDIVVVLMMMWTPPFLVFRLFGLLSLRDFHSQLVIHFGIAGIGQHGCTI